MILDVKVDLSSFGTGNDKDSGALGDGIEQAIIHEAAMILLGWKEHENVKGVGYVPNLAMQIRKEIEKQVGDALKTVIPSRINELVTETLKTGVQETDRFGDPVKNKPPRSMKQIMMDSLERVLNERVNSDGKVMTDSYSGYGTRIEWIVKNVTRGIVDNVASMIRAEVEGKVKERITVELAEAVKNISLTGR